MGFLLAGLGAAMVLIALPLGGCGHVHYF
jgi:hypothetical protein